jgi:hypothetical protein
MYETVVLDDQIVDTKAKQVVEFILDDGNAETENEQRLRAVTREGKPGDKLIFERLPIFGSLEQYVILPVTSLTLNGMPFVRRHSDASWKPYIAVAYCNENHKLIFLHKAIDKWGSRTTELSWAVYRSDGPSHVDLKIHSVEVMPLAVVETVSVAV